MSENQFLALVDTAGIQSYIFGSNRLVENIGASQLVALATGVWAAEAAQHLAGYRPVYSGGGNFVACFASKPEVEKFQYTLSRQVLQEAPGLQILIAWIEFDFKTDSLALAVEKGFGELAKLKGDQVHSTPLLGLGVTRACVSSGLPAVEIAQDREGNDLFISDAIAAKRKAAARANERLKETLEFVSRDYPHHRYEYPSDFDLMGRTHGDQSYLAVVHADGNGMGQRIQQIVAEYSQPVHGDTFETLNIKYCERMQSFSKALNDASTAALKATVNALRPHNEPFKGNNHSDRDVILHDDVNGLTIPLTRIEGENDAYYLPFRPIVFGGDDVTFVCDGRLALMLTQVYLENFEIETQKKKQELGGSSATACAGIAIVKSRFPFARAYELAEELAGSAKELRKAVRQRYPDQEVSCLDWHFALSGLGGTLDEIRRREYQIPQQEYQSAGNLTLRPVTLTANPLPLQNERAWIEISKLILLFQTSDWAEKRSKLKALRDAVREGRNAVERFCQMYRIEVDAASPFREGSWFTSSDGPRCRVFDAIELSDIYFPPPMERIANNITIEIAQTDPGNMEVSR